MRRLALVCFLVMMGVFVSCAKSSERTVDADNDQVNRSFNMRYGYFTVSDDAGTQVTVMEIGEVRFVSVSDGLDMSDLTRRFYLTAERLRKDGWNLDRQSIRLETGSRYWIWAAFVKGEVAGGAASNSDMPPELIYNN